MFLIIFPFLDSVAAPGSMSVSSHTQNGNHFPAHGLTPSVLLISPTPFKPQNQTGPTRGREAAAWNRQPQRRVYALSSIS